MLQVIGEKLADYALPAIAVSAIWYGIHYTFLAERITKVELDQEVQTKVNKELLPEIVITCVNKNLAKTIFEISRIEAAVYTASFRHFSNPYTQKKIDAERQVDIDCGVDAAKAKLAALKKKQEEEERIRREQEKHLALLREQKKLALEAEQQAIAMREEAEKRAKEAAKKAQEEALNQGISIFGEIIGSLSGGR